MSNKIPTAEEFLNNYRFKAAEHIGNSDFDVMAQYARDFAKTHIKHALQAAVKNVRTYTKGVSDGYETWDVEEIDEDSILKAYPLENIK